MNQKVWHDGDPVSSLLAYNDKSTRASEIYLYSTVTSSGYNLLFTLIYSTLAQI